MLKLKLTNKKALNPVQVLAGFGIDEDAIDIILSALGIDPDAAPPAPPSAAPSPSSVGGGKASAPRCTPLPSPPLLTYKDC